MLGASRPSASRPCRGAPVATKDSRALGTPQWGSSTCGAPSVRPAADRRAGSAETPSLTTGTETAQSAHGGVAPRLLRPRSASTATGLPSSSAHISTHLSPAHHLQGHLPLRAPPTFSPAQVATPKPPRELNGQWGKAASAPGTPTTGPRLPRGPGQKAPLVSQDSVPTATQRAGDTR